MMVEQQDFRVKGLSYTIRPAVEEDAKTLSEVRLKLDGETENFDREKGEGYIDESGFKKIIQEDAVCNHHLFLVAEVQGKIAGFIRAAGNNLKRTSHRVEFGIGVLKEYWGYGIGKNLLKELIHWADSNGIRKITLNVLETNQKAVKLYESFGFIVEGILRDDKLLSDGNYYNTIVMGRINEKR
ncbi:GNAT family N-acetyltransferase [Mesobacillus foraminis]|uniref:GNAT family N-acetyltransferase n=1 Tax=Mesobacillus foraminis TaxID=279826 RepID=UPI001BE85C93|nr:GNAT family N-acetyltransferase [Mesobacillus foraminis]MBT2756692.1 GNAT family N-acetyltransferase [Mesobacillus foraminis]